MVRVIFEDNHLLVLSKPAGLLTQSSGTEDENLQAQGKLWLKEKYHKPGLVFLEPIHRLDKAASGLVIFAKTSKALSRLTEEVRKRAVKKIYLAVVSRAPVPDSGTLTHYLVHDDYRARVVDKNASQAKLAILNYKILKQVKAGILLEIELITGRYHQIRAQLAKIGSPIVGDKKYGSVESWVGSGIALQHVHFEIVHPITKELLVFEDLSFLQNS